jgi:ERCC4-type nuclease
MIEPERVTAIIDSREQKPLQLSPLASEVATLTTGDYTARGCEELIRIERKSLPDLVACVGRDRSRFEREVDRLMAYPVRILLVESTWAAIEMGQWRGKVKPNEVIRSLLGWQARGLSVHMASNHNRAGKHVAKLLHSVVDREWQRLVVMSESVLEKGVGVCSGPSEGRPSLCGETSRRKATTQSGADGGKFFGESK